MFTVQDAALGYSVCLQGISLCRHYGHAAPAHGPTLQINHLGDFTSLKICQKRGRWPKKSLPRICVALPPFYCMNLLVAFFYCVSHHHQG